MYHERMIDYHLHGNFCGHAEGELEEYVLEALGKGFVEIGFADHLPKVVDPDPYHAMLEERLPEYVALVKHLQIKYAGSITIRLGIEADFFPGFEGRTRALLARAPFDYVLGSVHFLGDWHFTSKAHRDRYETEDPRSAFPRYFELLRSMISSGLFDVLAHPDALRRERFVPAVPPEREYAEIAAMLAGKGMAIEVNTAGLRRGAGSIYPDPALLAACHGAGVPVTLGSDAHIPVDVGRDFQIAFQLLEQTGITEIATYEGRRMVRRPIGEFRLAPGSGRFYDMLSSGEALWRKQHEPNRP
jgi:histidinol-phosphatase (PHP family)